MPVHLERLNDLEFKCLLNLLATFNNEKHCHPWFGEIMTGPRNDQSMLFSAFSREQTQAVENDLACRHLARTTTSNMMHREKARLVSKIDRVVI